MREGIYNIHNIDAHSKRYYYVRMYRYIVYYIYKYYVYKMRWHCVFVYIYIQAR